MAAVSRATYTAKVAWNRASTGYVTVGYSTIGSSDTIGASSWSQAFVGTYDDITAAVDSIDITRGRTSELDQMQVGRCVIEGAEKQRGLFNPANPSSPLAGFLDEQLHPLAVDGTFGGTTYRRFYGFTTSLEYKPGFRRGTFTIEAQDLFVWLGSDDEAQDLGGARPIIASTGPTTTGAAIGKILDAIGWTDPAFRSLDVGDSIPDFSADGTKTATDLIGDLLTAERGVVFVSATGAVVYRARNRRATAAVAATIADTMSDFAAGSELDRIRTRATVTRTGGAPQVVVDETTRRLYGYRDVPAILTPYLASDLQANSLANYILSVSKNPRQPLWTLDLDNRADALLTQMLARELEDKITVTESATGSTGDYFIEQIHEQITRAGHRAEWLLSKLPVSSPFVVGVDTVGSVKSISY